MSLRHCPPTETGFTMVELIVIMIIVSIMAVTVLPRMSFLGGFDAIGYADQIEAYLRYAQKSALAQRRNVRVVVSSDPSTAPLLCVAALAADSCPATCAVSNLSYPVTFRPASGVQLTGASSFCFDTMGRPSAVQSIAFKDSSGTLANTVVVAEETGYIHAN
jgi:MSHA pilin protein MshC